MKNELWVMRSGANLTTQYSLLTTRNMKYKIKKGDTVKVITGKDRNKTGKVLRVDRKNDRVLVEGINVYKKHVRPKTQQEKGQVIEAARSIHISNVMKA